MLVSKNSLEPSQHVRKSAWLEHAPFAFWLMQELRPRTVVELGTHNGFSFLSFCQAAKAGGIGARIYAIDTWQGDEHAGLYESEVHDSLRAELLREYPGIGTMVRSTFADARPQFADGSVDLLHIDGRHRYEDVLEDFQSWESALSDRAVVLFHDTRVETGDFGVWKFWAEISAAHPNFEFHHGNGLGVLVVGKKAPEALKALCALTPEEQAVNRMLYSRLGLVNSLDHQIDVAREQLGVIGEQAKLLTADRDRIANAFEQHRQAMDMMLSSTSWKLTAPLRLANRAGARISQLASMMQMLARRHGGYARLAQRSLNILRRDGLAGGKTAWARAKALRHGGNPLSGNDYESWLKRYSGLDEVGREKIRSEIASWEKPPLISVVMPVYNPEVDWLKEAIASVQAQLYPSWELCIADDRSTSEHVRPLLEKFAAADPRIRVVYRATNGHISEASNSALELASGSWMVLLDQDDLLTEDALYYVGRAISREPDVALIYSDEDKIENGRRYDPYFKPDWNPDLLRSHNMVCHLGAYRLDHVRAIGGFRKGFEGAQDYDLVLRFSERLLPGQICHIPRVLYHWRSHSGSTAQSGGNKNYAAIAGQTALNEHLHRTGLAGHIEILPTGMYRARYDLPPNPPKVSLIIPTRNGLRLLRQCVSSILEKTTYPNFEILIVDNNSDDHATLRYFDEIRLHERVKVVRDGQAFNYSAINNKAVSLVDGEYVGLINNDIEVVSPDWLSEMVAIAMQPKVGAVGARLWYPDDRLQHGGIILGIGGVAGHAHKMLRRGEHGYFSRGELTQTLSAVTAACLVVKKSTYELVGGLDAENLKVAFNDVDFCLKLREAGFRNVWTPYAELRHHESATRGVEDTVEKKERFQSEVLFMLRRWEKVLMADPAYNPNLTLEYEDFSLAWPPRNDIDPTSAS